MIEKETGYSLPAAESPSIASSHTFPVSRARTVAVASSRGILISIGILRSLLWIQNFPGFQLVGDILLVQF
jgi:hypothetical protein